MDYLLNIVRGLKNSKKQLILTISIRTHYLKLALAHDALYGDSKDLTKATASDKVLKYRAYEIALNPEYEGYQRELVSMMYQVLIRKRDQEAKQERM